MKRRNIPFNRNEKCKVQWQFAIRKWIFFSDLQSMSKLLCCLRSPKPSSDNAPLPDGDYLLPGGAWDPSISTSPSRFSRRTPRSRGSSRTSNSSIRSFWSRRFRGSSKGNLDSNTTGRGDYQAPPMVPSKTLPNSQDFRLLKTVGRGAFGKVNARQVVSSVINHVPCRNCMKKGIQ